MEVFDESFWRQIYVLRHGERKDQVGEQDNDPDFVEEIIKQKNKNCELTEKGKYQSFVTGRTLHQKFLPPAHKFDEPILVMSSPYLRCVQTAFNLITALKINNRKIHKNSIFVCPALKEYQSKNNKMSYRKLKRELSGIKLSMGVKLKELRIFRLDKFKLEKNSFETPSQSYVRSRELMEVLKNQSFYLDNFRPKIVICITHAFFQLNCMLQYAKQMEGLSPIEYCSMSRIAVEGDQAERDEMDVVNNSDHIEEYIGGIGFGDSNSSKL